MAGSRKSANLLSSPSLAPQDGLGANQRGLTMMDPSEAGFHGYRPDLENWTTMQYRTPRSIIPIVLDVPLMFDKLPDGGHTFMKNIKAFHEVHPVNITGLVHGENLEVDSVEIGGTGMLMEAPINVTAEVSSVTFEHRALRGDPYKKLKSFWLRNAVMDVRTKFPLISQYLNENEKRGAIMTLPWSTMSMAFIEPSVDGMHAEYTWIGSNMVPMSTGVTEGIRDLSSGQPIPVESTQYTGFYECNDMTRLIGDELLKVINDTSYNPEAVQAHISEINKVYKSQTTSSGYQALAAKRT